MPIVARVLASIHRSNFSRLATGGVWSCAWLGRLDDSKASSSSFFSFAADSHDDRDSEDNSKRSESAGCAVIAAIVGEGSEDSAGSARNLSLTQDDFMSREVVRSTRRGQIRAKK